MADNSIPRSGDVKAIAAELSGLKEKICQLGELLADGEPQACASELSKSLSDQMQEIHGKLGGNNSSRQAEADRLTEEILEVILALSALDFSKTLDVGFEDSGFNAVAAGLNMLGEELRRSVVSIEYVNGILEAMNDSLLVTNTEGKIRTINTFCSKLLGYDDGSLANVSLTSLLTQESYEKISGLITDANNDNVRALDVLFKTKSGQEIPMQINASVIHDNSGATSGVLLVGRDMRETLSLIAKAERSANAERRRAQELSAAHIDLESAHKELTGINSSLQSEISQRNIAEEKLKEAHDRLEQQVLERTKELRKTNEHLNNEVEERKRAEKEVRAREEKFRNIFDTASVAILEVDLTKLLALFGGLPAKIKAGLQKELAEDAGLRKEFLAAAHILDVNNATLSMLEAADKNALVERLEGLFFKQSWAWAEAAIAAIESKQNYFETSFKLKNLRGKQLEVFAQVKFFDLEDSRTGALITIVDLTETKSLKEQLRQSQKMEAVGRVAGGIAHDFNNLLTVILSYGQLVLDDLEEGSELRSRIEPMVDCSLRAAALTKQLLAFSRRQVIEPVVLNLNSLIDNMEKMLNRILTEEIRLCSEKAPDLNKIKADGGQIEQIVMNLAVNARDAMSYGGKLTISTKNVVIDDAEAKRMGDVAPGKFVLLEVADTGEGMPPEVKSRAFEPFYTTKRVGKGTGLGLSTVYGIVKQGNGHLAVESEIGVGTTFKIYFPAEAGQDISDSGPEKINKDLLKGSDTILVVEDEYTVRMVACSILKKAGYKVLECADPLLAIKLTDDQENKIDLLLSDVIMPNMKGPQMAIEICKQRPDLHVLFMSGYTDNAINQNEYLDEGKNFIQKPFTPKTLLTKIKEILDKSEDLSAA